MEWSITPWIHAPTLCRLDGLVARACKASPNQFKRARVGSCSKCATHVIARAGLGGQSCRRSLLDSVVEGVPSMLSKASMPQSPSATVATTAMPFRA